MYIRAEFAEREGVCPFREVHWCLLRGCSVYTYTVYFTDSTYIYYIIFYLQYYFDGMYIHT